MGLLFDEHPLVLSPTLATELGNLNEAVFVQQLHYWLEIKKQMGKNFIDGRYWIYNSVDEWLKQFPWLSSATLRRTIDNLVKKGFVIKGNFNQKKIDHTIWYSLNYEKIMEIDKKIKRQKEEQARISLDASLSEEKFESPQTVENKDFSRIAQNEQIELSEPANRIAQNEQIELLKMSKSNCSKRADRIAQNEQSNTIDYPLDYPSINNHETSTSSDNDVGYSPSEEVEEELKIAEEIMEAYNALCPSFPRAIKMTVRRYKLIRELLREGINESQVKEAFKKAEQSDFLTGRKPGAEWTRFDFDWFIQSSSIISLMEGKYDNVSAQAQKRISQNQAMIDKAKQNLVDIKPLTVESVSDYNSFFKESLKRHHVYPEDISDKEVMHYGNKEKGRRPAAADRGVGCERERQDNHTGGKVYSVRTARNGAATEKEYPHGQGTKSAGGGKERSSAKDS